MSCLVDTNVISELRKRDKANRGVRQWFESVKDEQLFLSVLVVGELRQGVETIRRRDPVAAERLDAWLRVLVADFGDSILPVDFEVASMWGRLNVPNPLPSVDGLLAATALVHGLTLVTRNVKDVASTGARLLNPFVQVGSATRRL